MTWQDLNIDSRIIGILEQFDYAAPFEAELDSIPALLEGKDVFVHARTGTGKTIVILVAFLEFLAQNPGIRCVILSPTHELVAETYSLFRETLEVAREVNLGFVVSALLDEKAIVQPNSNVIVSTPFLLSKEEVEWADVRFLVLDEADLMFEMMENGPASDIMRLLPARTQKLMLSATLSEDVENFRNFALRDPTLISMAETVAGGNISNYYIESTKKETKFLELYCLTKLKMLSGNIILFAKSQRQGYRLMLFLRAFNLNATVFDPKMPQATRLAELDVYNEVGGILIIAGKTEDVDAARGLDFNQVDFVICFDFPGSFEEYQHAIGRCARGLNTNGSSYLFMNPTKNAEQLAEFQALIEKSGAQLEEFTMEESEMEPFAYRIRDIYSRLTDKRIEEAISAQVKRQLLKSDYAKRILDTEENKKALSRIRHPEIAQVHQLPDYLEEAARALEAREVVGTASRRAMQEAAKDRKKSRITRRKAIVSRKKRVTDNWKRNNGRIEPPKE